MAYPTLPMRVDVSETLGTDRQVERATNGTVRGRAFYTSPKRTFRFQHPGLKTSEVDTLMAFYTANMSNTFTFTWPVDGQAYVVIFGREVEKKSRAGSLLDVTVELLEA